MSEYRINGFEQIKAFYSWVFNNAKERVTPQHISLYLFLINQNNRSNWIEWFKVPFDLGMAGACIGNKKTYYSCLNDLVSWNLIEYEKGTNEYKAPLIKIEVLKSTSHDTAPVPLPEPLLQPLPTTLPIPLPTHIYKLITDNIKLITDNEKIFKKFIKSLKETNADKSAIKTKNLEFRKTEFKNNLKPFLEIYGKDLLNDFFRYWTETNQGGKKMRFEMQTVFDIKRRLATWHKNSTKNNFTKQQTTKPLIADTSEVDKARRLQQEYLESLKKHETLIN